MNQIMNYSKRMKRILGLILCFGIAAFVWGCTSGEPDTAGGSEAVTSDIGQGKDLSAIKIGYCTPSLNAPFYVVLEKSIKENVTSNGMKYVNVDGQGDINKQIIGIEDLMSKGVQAIILNPLDPKALVPSVNRAVKSGIPVFIVDSYIESEADYVASILADNQGNGELLGQWMADKMSKQAIHMAIVSGAAGNPVGREKRLGFIRGVADRQLKKDGSSRLDIVAQGWGNWTISGGLNAMEDILVAHPEVNVVVAENDEMALGALRAIGASANEKDVKIVGFDAQKDALKLIKEGEMDATALNSPVELGELVVNAAVKYFNGEKDSGKIIHTKATIINKSNVDKYYDPNSLF